MSFTSLAKASFEQWQCHHEVDKKHMCAHTYIRIATSKQKCVCNSLACGMHLGVHGKHVGNSGEGGSSRLALSLVVERARPVHQSPGTQQAKKGALVAAECLAAVCTPCTVSFP